jgi:mono/diheme cytochrome c family protein
MLLAVAMTLGACESDPTTIVTPTPDTSATPGTTAASLYRYHCASCHGLDGRPTIAGGPELRDWDSSYAFFDTVMTTGPGIMPQYPHIDQTQRRLLYDFIRGFSR